MTTCILFESGMKGMGITFHLSHLVCEIHKQNSNIVIIHDGTEQEKGLLQSLKEKGIEDFDYSKNSIHLLLKYLRQKGYNKFIFHAESYGGCRLIEPFKKQYNIHVLLGMNAYKYSTPYRSLVLKYIKHRYSQIVDTWIFFSQQARLDFCHAANIYNHTFVIPWGVENFITTSKATHYTDVFKNKTYLYQSNIKYVFYAAQFYKNKSHRLLISIMKKYLHDGQVKLVLAGNGIEINNIHQLCIKYGIDNNVIFLGRIPRPIFITHLKNAFLSLVLSKNETFGHCILEPLQMGVPVISTPTGIAPQIITDFYNGFVINRSNKNKWKNIIAHVINGSIHLEPKYQELFTWSEVAKLYSKLYHYISEDMLEN